MVPSFTMLLRMPTSGRMVVPDITITSAEAMVTDTLTTAAATVETTTAALEAVKAAFAVDTAAAVIRISAAAATPTSEAEDLAVTTVTR